MTNTLNIKNRDLVLPGQLIGEKIRSDLECIREGASVFSPIQGLVKLNKREIGVIPLAGIYKPRREDVVIGVITKVLRDRWLVEINSPYSGSMSGEEATRNQSRVDLTDYFRIGDVISAKIARVDEVYSSTLILPWKLTDGQIIEVNPKRVPRIIGKKRSMINMIKEKTRCGIVVGQNGRIWIKGGQDNLVVEAIRKIEREAYTTGLTDRIGEMLDKCIQDTQKTKIKIE